MVRMFREVCLTLVFNGIYLKLKVCCCKLYHLILIFLCSDGLKDHKIPGVTNPYCYIGSWKSMFGWHKEDMDLYSINFLHYGQPKFWYGIDIRDNKKFEKFMSKVFPESFNKCNEFIRHKTTFVQAKVLMENGIRCVKNVHY